jgi:hypothetical protein
MQVETHPERYAPDNEEAYAHKYGRIVRLGRPSRRLILLAVAAIITLAVVAFAV